MTSASRPIRKATVIGVLGLTALVLLTVWTLQPFTPREFSSGEYWQTDKLLLKDTDVVRLRILAQMIRSKGESCGTATTAFWQHTNPAFGDVTWNVRCDSGGPFVVRIANDQLGSSKVRTCTDWQQVTGVTCFKKLSEQ